MENTVKHSLKILNLVFIGKHMLNKRRTGVCIWLFLFGLLHVATCDNNATVNNTNKTNGVVVSKEENVELVDVKPQTDVKSDDENINTKSAPHTDTVVVEPSVEDKSDSTDLPNKPEQVLTDLVEATRDQQPTVTDGPTAEHTNTTASGEENSEPAATQDATKEQITAAEKPVTIAEKLHQETTTEQPRHVPVTTEQPHIPTTITEAPPLDSIQITVPPPRIPDDGVDLSKHDMKDFEDWRKEFLAKDPKINGGNNKEVMTNKGAPLGQTKLRNVASTECGAKIVFSNTEAQQANFALNENRDRYMNQPCYARKWLIIGLCEPVQLRRLEMANLESFSSTFKNFTVYIMKSDTKDERIWLKSGSFEAKDERQIQIFQLLDTPFYTSTVKIEFDAHHGQEHFCPITLIRLYGFAVDDDDDDDDDDTQTVPPGPPQKGEEMEASKPAELLNKTQHRSVNGLNDISWMFISRDECLKTYLSWSDVPARCGKEAEVYNGDSVFNKTVEVRNISLNIQPHQQTVSTDNVNEQKLDREDFNKTDRPDVESGKPTVDLPHIKSREDFSDKTENAELDEIPEPDDNLFPSPPVLPIPPTVTLGSDNQPPIPEPVQPHDNQQHNKLETSDTTTQQPATTTPTEPTTQQPDNVEESFNEQKRFNDDLSVGYKEDTESEDSEDKVNSQSAMRNKKLTPIGKLSNRVSELELNVSVTTKYLEEMSRKYKQQKDDLQYALNRTMRTLQNVTLKYDDLMLKYNELIVKTHQLTLTVGDLESKLNKTDTSPSLFSYIIVLVVVFSLTLISCCKRTRQQLTQQEIQEMLAAMPAEPRIHIARRGSEGSLTERESSNTSVHLTKSLSTVELKHYRSEHENPTISSTVLSDLADKSSTESENKLSEKFGETDLIERQSNNTQVETIDKDETDGPHYEIIMPTTWRTYDTPNSKSAQSQISQPVHKRKKKNKHKPKFRLIDETPTDQPESALPDHLHPSHNLRLTNGAIDTDGINTINTINNKKTHPGIVSWLAAVFK